MEVNILQMDVNILQIGAKLQELLDIAKYKATCCECGRALHMIQGHNLKRNDLGQSIFHLLLQFHLTSVPSDKWRECVTDGVMMDDSRLVLCLNYMDKLLISNTDGSQTDSIPLQYNPWYVTAVNNSTVAVTSLGGFYVEMFNINNKHKLKSIKVPGVRIIGITTIDNKLVVGSHDELYIIDHQTGKAVQKIIKEKKWTNILCVKCVHATGDRIFYSDGKTNNLHCYSYTDDKNSATTLPSIPYSITSLQDGSLYVVCKDGSVQHMSSDEKHYKAVTTEGLTSVGACRVISYNKKQRKLFTCDLLGHVNVLHEI